MSHFNLNHLFNIQGPIIVLNKFNTKASLKDFSRNEFLLIIVYDNLMLSLEELHI